WGRLPCLFDERVTALHQCNANAAKHADTYPDEHALQNAGVHCHEHALLHPDIHCGSHTYAYSNEDGNADQHAGGYANSDSDQYPDDYPDISRPHSDTDHDALRDRLAGSFAHASGPLWFGGDIRRSLFL